jgi:hypothetical protein
MLIIFVHFANYAKIHKEQIKKNYKIHEAESNPSVPERRLNYVFSEKSSSDILYSFS